MKIFIISDIQAPMEDRRMVDAVQEAAKDYKPDLLLCVGDEADAFEPSRWNKGLAAEMSGTLQAGLDRAHEIMTGFRDAVGKKTPFISMRSNHGDRIQNYIKKYAPALTGLRSLEYEVLLGYEELGIDYKTKPYEFVRGAWLAHGDEGSLIRTPAGTAMGLAKRWGVQAVFAGHTHKMGIQHDHLYLNNRPRALRFGVEVGHLMDLNKASYLKAGSANWQAGFATAEFDNGRTFPAVHPIINRRFTLEGRVYHA